jgi:electron transport complex protein RnfG
MSVAIKSSAPAANVSSFRLLGTMATTGAVAGLLIVLAYTTTHPIILANRASAIERAIHEVLPGIDRYETLYVQNGALTARAPEAGANHEAEHVYVGLKGPDIVGFAIPAKEPGFQDPIEILFGFDPKSNTTLGVTIISSRETPGLGDKIQDDTWRAQFKGAPAPVNATKRGAVPPGDVLMITGATISSRAVVAAINTNLAHWQPLLGAYAHGEQP